MPKKAFEILIEPELQFSLDIDANFTIVDFLFKPTLPVPYQAQTGTLSTEKIYIFSKTFQCIGLASWAFKKGHLVFMTHKLTVVGNMPNFVLQLV